MASNTPVVAVDVTGLRDEVDRVMDLLATLEDHDPAKAERTTIAILRAIDRRNKIWNNDVVFALLRVLRATIIARSNNGG